MVAARFSGKRRRGDGLNRRIVVAPKGKKELTSMGMAGYSPLAKICTIAAYKRARRALRGKCEPDSSRGGARKGGSKRDRRLQKKEKAYPIWLVLIRMFNTTFVGVDVLGDPQQTNFGRELVFSADLCYNGVYRRAGACSRRDERFMPMRRRE